MRVRSDVPIPPLLGQGTTSLLGQKGERSESKSQGLSQMEKRPAEKVGGGSIWPRIPSRQGGTAPGRVKKLAADVRHPSHSSNLTRRCRFRTAQPASVAPLRLCKLHRSSLPEPLLGM